MYFWKNFIRKWFILLLSILDRQTKSNFPSRNNRQRRHVPETRCNTHVVTARKGNTPIYCTRGQYQRLIHHAACLQTKHIHKGLQTDQGVMCYGYIIAFGCLLLTNIHHWPYHDLFISFARLYSKAFGSTWRFHQIESADPRMFANSGLIRAVNEQEM